MTQPRLSRLALLAAGLAAWVVAAGPTLAQGGPPSGPPAVTAARPVVKDIVEYDDYTGRFEAVDTVELRARVTGFIDRVAFKDGAVVKEGDLLVVIDPRPYKAALDQAEAGISSAKSRVDFAQGDLDRAEALRRTGNTTEQLLDQRRQSYLTAKADLDKAEAGVRQARLDIGFTEIRAPLGGRISRRLVDAGNLVNANQTVLASIVSVDPIHFYFDIDERAFLSYKRVFGGATMRGESAPVPVLVALTDEKEPTHEGRIDFIDNRVDQATGTMRVRAIMPNPDGFLTPGLFGRVRVPGSKRYRGVLVPDEAVASDQDRRIVWTVAADGSVASRVVRPGPKIDGYRVIREGLTGDETIVVDGLQRVRPGAKVAPKVVELPPTRA